ncbi:MAG TPA: hypothetical protein VJT78_02740 [Candidatus Dormibacteraeota bacterium]|nr:hypothetical protein [Candidatus Dormibacteraeota bacterium]
MDQLLGELQSLLVQLTQLLDIVAPFTHPKDLVVGLLKASIGLVGTYWDGFVLSTTNVDAYKEAFVSNVVIRRYEPEVQLTADGALLLVVIWASFRIMWGHGLFTQYTARILLPRLFMAAVLINFSQPLFQMVVDASNTLSTAAQTFVTLDNPLSICLRWVSDPSAGMWDIVTTAVLAVGYDALAIAYLVRYTVLVVLSITAPLAGLLFLLPETQHLSKMWISHFTTNLFMQPMQLFVLSIGFTLEGDGKSPLNHLFALATLLIVFKVPGAMGVSEKAAHKLESTVHSAFTHLAHAMAKA